MPDLHAIFIERRNTVRVGLVVATVPAILLAVLEEDLVQLLDVVFGEGNVLPGVEYQIHQFSVSSHFLFVSSRKRLDLEV